MAQPVAIKSIFELTQDDINMSTSLYVVEGCSNVNRGEVNKKITIGKKKYDIMIASLKNMRKRDLKSIVGSSIHGREWGCVYYVLNASSVDEVRDRIEEYAEAKGMDPHGRAKFCYHESIKLVYDAIAEVEDPRRGHMPRNITSPDPLTAAAWMNSEMGSMDGGDRSRHSYAYGSSVDSYPGLYVAARTTPKRASKSKDGEPLSPLHRIKQRSNPRRTGGRKNRRRSVASRSRKNYRG